MRVAISRRHITRVVAALLAACVLAFCHRAHAQTVPAGAYPDGGYGVFECLGATPANLTALNADGCAPPLGLISVVDSTALNDNAYVAVCVADPTCSVTNQTYVPLSAIGSMDGVQVQNADLSAYQYITGSQFLAQTSPAGGVSQGAQFDISALDLTQAGEAFAAGFVIVGMCWALGKAVGMIVSIVKR